MSFRKVGGLQYSATQNIVKSRYNTADTLYVTKNVGQPNTYINFDSDISGNILVYGDFDLSGNLNVAGDVDISGNETIAKNLYVLGDIDCSGNLYTGEDAYINNVRVGRGEGDIITNTVVGNTALNSNTSGYFNTAVGYNALSANTDGADNTAVGVSALASTTSGFWNTALGLNALVYNTTGYHNTAVGLQAGINNTYNGPTNSIECTFVGMNTFASANNLQKSTAIGYRSTISASNQIVLGTSTEKVFIPTNLQIGGTFNGSTTNALDVSGNSNFSKDVTAEYMFLSSGNNYTTASNGVVPKSYVDSVASGLNPLPDSVLCSNAGFITLSGYGQVIDGFTIGPSYDGSAVLINAQGGANIAAITNGVYIVSSGTWSRASYLNTGASAIGTIVPILSGVTYKNYKFVCTSSAPGTIGTTPVLWSIYDTGSPLSQVLAQGNNAGSYSIDMNGNAITSASSVTATTFYGALSGNASSASDASNVTVSAAITGSWFPTFVAAQSGNRAITTDADFTWNAGTNTLSLQSIVATTGAQITNTLTMAGSIPTITTNTPTNNLTISTKATDGGLVNISPQGSNTLSVSSTQVQVATLNMNDTNIINANQINSRASGSSGFNLTNSSGNTGALNILNNSNTNIDIRTASSGGDIVIAPKNTIALTLSATEITSPLTQPASTNSSTKIPTTAWVQGAITGGTSASTSAINTTSFPGVTGTYYFPYVTSSTGTTGQTPYADGNISFDRTNNTLNVPNLSMYGAIVSTVTITNATSNVITTGNATVDLKINTKTVNGGNIVIAPRGEAYGLTVSTTAFTSTLATTVQTANGNTSVPSFIIKDTMNINFIPNCGSGSFNNFQEAGDSLIYCAGTAVNTGILSLSTWSNNTNGVKIKPNEVLIGAGGTASTPTSSIKFDGSGSTMTLNGDVSIVKNNITLSSGTSDLRIGLSSTGAINLIMGVSVPISMNFSDGLNTIYGNACGTNMTTGAAYNTLMGHNSAPGLTSGLYNTFIGYGTGFQGGTAGIGSYNTCVGNLAGNGMTTSSQWNTLVGSSASIYLTTGSYNTSIGTNTAIAISSGNYNTFMGVEAGPQTNANPLSGSYNTCLGYRSGYSMITSATENTMMGTGSGQGITTGSSNLILGVNAGYQITTGGQNSFLGKNSGFGNTTGTYNVFIGYNSGFQSGAVGTGSQNVCVGVFAGDSMFGAARDNTLLGYEAGQLCNSGNDNILIGSKADVNIGSLSNTIAIGKGTKTLNANEVRIGNSSNTFYGIYGTWSNTSDIRDKKNIHLLDAGLNFINLLKPVRFDWNMRDGGKKDISDVGFIAQDLLEAQNNSGIQIPGLVYDKNPEQLMMSSSLLIPILVKSVQEMSSTITRLEAEINELKTKI